MAQASTFFLLAALVAALVSLAVSVRSGGGRPSEHAPARGSAARGVLYAFTTAFAPWAKESARQHLPSYLAGIVFHLATFAALAWALASAAAPAPAALAAVGGPLAALAGLGLACGLGLLAKRATTPRLRALSVPDDFVASVLVNAMLAAAIAAGLRPGAQPLLRLAAGLVLLYLPLGKLRHMVYLPLARRFWGRNFGRRGTLPQPGSPR